MAIRLKKKAGIIGKDSFMPLPTTALLVFFSASAGARGIPPHLFPLAPYGFLLGGLFPAAA